MRRKWGQWVVDGELSWVNCVANVICGVLGLTSQAGWSRGGEDGYQLFRFLECFTCVWGRHTVRRGGHQAEGFVSCTDRESAFVYWTNDLLWDTIEELGVVAVLIVIWVSWRVSTVSHCQQIGKGSVKLLDYGQYSTHAWRMSLGEFTTWLFVFPRLPIGSVT